MGMFTKSLVILLIAVSVPLVYRQFANDNTIKFMSSYYSNYNVVDQFLRQSAGHLDRAKEYLPNTEQMKDAVGQLSKQVTSMIDTIESRATSKDDGKSEQNIAGKKVDKKKDEQNHRMSNCQGEAKGVRVWTKKELSNYDGTKGPTIYLGFLGVVFDVTMNAQHYAAGAEYSAFAGRDATRAFITGNFTHDLNDDLNGIDESLYSHLEGWAQFYGSSYPNLGRIIGKYYDSNGCPTAELHRVYQIFGKLAREKEDLRQKEYNFPDCNSEWNGDLNKGKVWCSKMSGGIEREWVGVPRLYNNGETTRCACYNIDGPDAAVEVKFMSEYPNCDPKATECPISK